jgi:ribosomal protein L11 methyltransferase
MNKTMHIQAGAHAFGDGAHPTTRGVLEALAMIDPAEFTPRNACDMGAGSGILSFAIIEKFGCPVVAVDMAASAVATLKENARRNGLDSRMTALQADGFEHPEIAAHAPYDLITMNILAEPLVALAATAADHLASGGVLVMSGVLVWQEAKITESYQCLGLELASRLQLGDWVTLVWQKEGAA